VALSDLPRTITVTHEDKDLAAVVSSGLGGLADRRRRSALSLWWNRVPPPSRPAPAATPAGHGVRAGSPDANIPVGLAPRPGL